MGVEGPCLLQIPGGRSLPFIHVNSLKDSISFNGLGPVAANHYGWCNLVGDKRSVANQ